MWRSGPLHPTPDSSHPPTRDYAARHSKEGLSKLEIIRCLKRYLAREVYPHLRG
jgi:transposase